MPDAKTIAEDLNFVTDRLSTQVRTLALGLLGLVWAIAVGEIDGVDPAGSALTRVAFLAILAMAFDLAQYVSAYLQSTRVLTRAEASEDGTASYDSRSALYRARVAFFWGKLVTAGAGTGYLLAVLAPYMAG